MNGVFCFVEGTLVLSAEGHVPIEDIVVGDLVWAEETTTGEKDIKKVVNTFVNETSELVHVYVNGEEIVSTPNHPFYSPVRGWVEAINLRAGDMLVLQNGAYVVVAYIQHEILEVPIKVYNFEVEDYHTYYVGENSVLVHNECGAAKKAKLPTSGKIRYIPPAGSGDNLPRTSSGGYIDKFNNVWIKGPSRTSGEPFEWDVQLSRTGYGMLNWLSRDGKHINVSLKGNITH